MAPGKDDIWSLSPFSLKERKSFEFNTKKQQHRNEDFQMRNHTISFFFVFISPVFYIFFAVVVDVVGVGGVDPFVRRR
jgi:glucose uptake protein GlcU